ncbi:gliding motility protein [Flavobacterium sp.]|uniref:type IX secretion system periplasmic lipoprotein PorW/SprE n=1 Tax=Flavobacterium sp. TaxID=239 RepID=UPI00352721F7
MNTRKKIILFLLGLFVIACSVKKDKFINRNYHALTTQDNVLYNGNLALTSGLEELELTYRDNFWELLPVERMPEKQENFLPGEKKDPNFERAEEKAVKAIQKHAMNIGGKERNPQMDEAYLLLGKARYYSNRFVPSLEALNYILYKYPESDKIYQAKVWREKVNIRLDNNELAINNLKLLLKHNKLEDQDLADANAMLAQAYANIKIYDTAVSAIKIAKENTKINEQKARYGFILGQLYNQLNYPDSAYTAFQEVIDLNRKAPRRYVIQAHAQQANMFDYEKGDTLAFVEKFNKLLKDRENRPYLDVLNYQLGYFYDNLKKDSLAKVYYNKSLRTNLPDRYLQAKDYTNIASIYFEEANYKTAGKYYDSTLLRLEPNTREFRQVKKKRENLDDVIKYEEIAQQNDSILHIASLTSEAQIKYYEKYIEKLKKQDEAKAKLAAELAEKEANKAANATTNSNAITIKNGTTPISNQRVSSMMPPGSNESSFYFYNQAMVAMGKAEFLKKWGKRAHVENWRQAAIISNKINTTTEENEEEKQNNEEEEIVNPAYTVTFYTEQIPTEQKVLDSIAKDRNNAYYQLGLIYKEKFKEYKLAANRLEKLLTLNPEERLILPTKYNLVKIYEILNPDKAIAYKNDIITNYPSSRYAEILKNPKASAEDESNPENVFTKLYKAYENNEIRKVQPLVKQKINDYFGEEILPKFEMLNAAILARTNGLNAYKEALNYIALTYPNTSEGKEAQQRLQQDIPKLEKLSFTDEDLASWKIIFPKTYTEGSNYENLLKPLEQYIKDSNTTNLSTSVDVYTLTNDFVVLHGFTSKEKAKGILSYLQEYKAYKIKDVAYVISSENYKVVQINKQFDEWLKLQNN